MICKPNMSHMSNSYPCRKLAFNLISVCGFFQFLLLKKNYKITIKKTAPEGKNYPKSEIKIDKMLTISLKYRSILNFDENCGGKISVKKKKQTLIK